MHKSRKLLTAAAISLALASTASHGLTLGDIEMRSALNQTMDARISLKPATPNEIDGIRVTLASSDAFARAGLSRTASLNDLQFSVDRSVPGQPVIRVSSSRPVVEPFLNFLLEVDWPQGRLVREYTVLLDPPVFLSPDQSQRATISENTTTRASDISGVPVPIERVATTAVDLTGGSEFTFDESSVQIIGNGGEVDDSIVFGDAAVTAAESEIVTGQTFTEADVTSEVTFDSATFTEGEVVVLDENAPAFQTPGSTSVGVSDDLDVEIISGSTDLGGEIVTLTDNDTFSSSGSTFATASVTSESFNGFDVQILGDTQEVGDDVGSVISSGDTNFATNATSTASGAEVVVRNGDTLTQIARSNRISGVSTQQMMIALLEANQQAFINGNINLLKAGAILRIPDSAALSSVSQAQALAEVAEQEQLWREYRDSLRGTSSTRVASTPAPTATQTAESPSTDAPDTDSAADVEATVQGEDSISQSAQDILDEARRELEEARSELRLVGDSDASDTASSTSADESDQPETENLGEINRELQLAREELAATQLKTSELESREESLGGTADRIDTLVELRQNEVARLEQQLADARGAGESAVEDATGGLPQVDLFDETESDSDATGTESGESDSAATGISAEQTEDTSRVIQPATNTKSQNASSAPWYQQLLNNKLLIAAGVGLLALLGLLATMFKRRGSRKVDQFDAFDEDDVEFLDEFGNEASSPGAYAPEADGDVSVDDELDATRDNTGSHAVAAAGAAGVAAVAAGAGSAQDEVTETIADNVSEIDASMLDYDPAEATLAEGDGGSGDEVLSEADVYMAYGLHGQAEDLLTKAVAENPDNPVYQEKLLEAFHKQNNTSSFDEASARYSQKFGTTTPAWAGIKAMGSELNPSNDLYKSAGSAVASIGGGSMDAPRLDDQDFASDNNSEGLASSVRDFSDNEGSSGSADETGLFDQTLDPGTAFEAADLEATGDFTRYTEELNQSVGSGGDAGNSLLDKAGDMAGSAGDAVTDTASGVADASKAAVGGVAAGAAGLAAGVAGAVGLGNKDAGDAPGDGDSIDFDTSIQSTELDLDAPAAGSGGSLDMPSASDDLTMDLDQISGDLTGADSLPELDDALEINDLTAADLTADASLSIGDTDEMDTMMDLAKAYIDMGDNDSASSALDEIVKSGNPEQRSEAETLLRKIS